MIHSLLFDLAVITLLIGSGCAHTIPAGDLKGASPTLTYTQNDYLIGEGDELTITMTGAEVTNTVHPVSTKGTITLPYIGEVAVADRTASNVQADLQEAIKPFVKITTIGVIVSAKKSNRAYFTGEFTRTGAIPLEGKISLLQGISLAGGLTPFATGRIVIIRKEGRGPSKRYAADIDDILDGKENYDSFALGRFDTVIAE